MDHPNNSPEAENWAIRHALNEDGPGIIRLIDNVLGEWQDAVCLEGSEQDLLDVESSYWRNGGAFFVMEADEQIVGTHAILPIPERSGLCTFKRLYLTPTLRGSQAGTELMNWNINWARDHEFERVEFWSDTRFKRAHQFFLRFGFEPSGQEREMNDSHQTYFEYHFFLDLT